MCTSLPSLVTDLEMRGFSFPTFGKEFIKRHKFSPDSFFQMAIQLAFYRIHQTPGGHYESGGLRVFSEGRTDIIRSCSEESVDFAKKMSDGASDLGERYEAMTKAIQAHSAYAKMVKQRLVEFTIYS